MSLDLEPHPDESCVAQRLLPPAVSTVENGASCYSAEVWISSCFRGAAGAALCSDGVDLLDSPVFIASCFEGLDQEEPGVWHELDVMMIGVFL